MRFSRHLEIGQFLAELKELKVLAIPPNDSVLERLERQRILIPLLRLRYPDPIERRWYAMERLGYRRPKPTGPKEPIPDGWLLLTWAKDSPAPPPPGPPPQTSQNISAARDVIMVGRDVHHSAIVGSKDTGSLVWTKWGTIFAGLSLIVAIVAIIASAIL